MPSHQNSHNTATKQAIEIAIQLGVIFLIAYWCFLILSPFIGLIVWGAIIAVALYKPFEKLVEKVGGRRKLAVILVAVLGAALILLPVINLSTSIIDSAQGLRVQITDNTLRIPPPAETVKGWPIIGEKAYAFWQQASTDLTVLLKKYPEQVSAIGKKLLGTAAGAGLGALQLTISLLIAVAFLSGAEAASRSMARLASRLSPDDGEALLTMSVNTIRSVAVGVIGIAFIQATLGGLGMLVVGIPMAGILAVVILILGIAQLPPWFVLLPAIIYVFSIESTGVAVVFMIWSLIVSFSDVVLKPVLLGRGVDAPMIVILLGAIGGMLTAGIIGLFIGAVVLALGYKLFQAWLEMAETQPVNTATNTEAISDS
ncbi:MAG: AI-2E family transporter [Xanthomonadales bacterium]|nr:AI-2E family transporter [Xanthomonadales bacterium]